MIISRNGKVDLANNQKLFTHLKLTSSDTDPNETSLSVTVLRGSKAWSATLSPEFFKTNAKRTQTKVKQYVDMTMEALGCPTLDVAATKFVCEIMDTEDEEATSVLIWKKKLPGEDMVFKLGTTKLKRENADDVVQLMLTFDQTETARLQASLATSQAAGAQLVTERDDALAKYREAVHAKQELERELLTKFVSILNEKKAKIRTLIENEKKLAAKRSADATCEDTSAKRKQVVTKKCAKRPEQMHFSDSGSDGIDVADDVKNTTPPKRDKMKTTGASTSAALDHLDDFEMDVEQSPVEFVPLRARVRAPKNKLAAVEIARSSADVRLNVTKQQPQHVQSAKAECHPSTSKRQTENKVTDTSTCDTLALVDDM